MEPINVLSKEKVPFNCGPEHQSALTFMKKEIAKAPILAYYNPKKQKVLQTYTGIKGLGACLLQDEKPLYFASKALTKHKRVCCHRVRVISSCMAMEKFHHFLYASHFILETDQKPLEAILSKSLNQVTLKLQRILIRPFPYHFTVHYIPGLTNQFTDCLSQMGGQKDTIKLLNLHLYQITNQLSTRCESLNQLRLAVQEDNELVLVKHTIIQGWPSTIKEVPNVLQPFWTCREELTVEDGLVLKNTRIVIPNKKHEAVLKLIHEGHLGLNKCKMSTKDTVY